MFSLMVTETKFCILSIFKFCNIGSWWNFNKILTYYEGFILCNILRQNEEAAIGFREGIRVWRDGFGSLSKFMINIKGATNILEAMQEYEKYSGKTVVYLFLLVVTAC